MYNSSLKAKIDYENTISFAEEKAYYKGQEKGIEKGEHTKALEIAHNLKNMGFTDNDIVKSTGLSIDEVKTL